QMAFRSKTHKGEGYNEMRFEDAKGGEGLFMHAQKDMTTMVLNDRTTTVLADHTETVAKDQTITVLQNHNTTVSANHSVAIQGDQVTVIGGSREEAVQGPLVLSSATGIRLVCGAAVIELDTNGNISLICNNFNFYGSAAGQVTTGGVLDLNMDGGGPGTQAGPSAEAIAAAVKAAFPPATQ
ncbi:bacteriophage T4 gp5 trimerisation domain-containing protein, partial [Yersinia similis]